MANKKAITTGLQLFLRPHVVFASLFFLTLVVSVAFAQTSEFNPKSVQSITLRILQSGTLDVAGSVEKMNLTLYIPQDGVQSLDVNSNQHVDWRYDQDKFGNKVIVMEWTKPTDIVQYQLDIIVKNDARIITHLPGIGSDPAYLNRTAFIVINDGIRKAAYPFEKSWDNVASLTDYVYKLVDYDVSTVGERYPSDWVLQNKRGVCVEHANLLTALLRASGIPTRYVVGYAYSTLDKKLIGHTWVEVLASDGTWVPFDPTWLQGAYLDATHIKTANLLDDSQLDVLAYMGTGSVVWKRGERQGSRSLTGELYSDTVEIISYTVRNITSIRLEASPVGLGDYGYIKATATSDVCTINRLTAASCVDQSDNSAFDIMEENQTFFSCNSYDVYWFYKEVDGKRRYICPVTVFDQAGSIETTDVEVEDRIGQSKLSIAGPSVVSVGESFTLTASASSFFIFYSPGFGKHSGIRWDLQINRPGGYKFYLYSANSLAEKDVFVVEQKEFNVDVKAPLLVKYNSSFAANITVKNLLEEKTARILIEFDGQKTEKILVLAQDEEKYLQLNFTATRAGQRELTVSVVADTLTPYTAVVNVEEPEIVKTRSIIDVINDFFSSLAAFFRNLF